MTCLTRVSKLEVKMKRIESLLWYIAGTLSVKFGSEIIPIISASLR